MSHDELLPTTTSTAHTSQSVSVSVADVTAMLVRLHDGASNKSNDDDDDDDKSTVRAQQRHGGSDVDALGDGVYAARTWHTFCASDSVHAHTARTTTMTTTTAAAAAAAVVQWDAAKSMAAPPRHVPCGGDVLAVRSLHGDKDGCCDACEAALHDGDDVGSGGGAVGVQYTLLRRRGARVRAVVLLRCRRGGAPRATVQPVNAAYYFVTEHSIRSSSSSSPARDVLPPPPAQRPLSSAVSAIDARDDAAAAAKTTAGVRRAKTAAATSTSRLASALERQQRLAAATTRLLLQRRIVAWVLQCFARHGSRVRAMAMTDVEAAFPVLLLLLHHSAAARRAFVAHAIDRFARDELRCFDDAIVRIRAHAQRCFLLVDTAPHDRCNNDVSIDDNNNNNDDDDDDEVQAERRVTALQLALTGVLLVSDARARDVFEAAAALLRRLAAGTAPRSTVLLRSLALVLQPLHGLVVGGARVPRDVCDAIVRNLYAVMHAEHNSKNSNNNDHSDNHNNDNSNHSDSVHDVLRALQSALRRRDGAASAEARRRLARALQHAALHRGRAHTHTHDTHTTSSTSHAAAAAARPQHGAATALRDDDGDQGSLPSTSLTTSSSLPSVLQAHEPSVFFAPTVAPATAAAAADADVAATTTTTTMTMAAMLRATTTTATTTPAPPPPSCALALERGTLRTRALSARELPAASLRRALDATTDNSNNNNNNSKDNSNNNDNRDSKDARAATHLDDMLALYHALSLRLQPLDTLVGVVAGGGQASAPRSRTRRGAAVAATDGGDVANDAAAVAAMTATVTDAPLLLPLTHELPALQLNLGKHFATTTATSATATRKRSFFDRDDDDDDDAYGGRRDMDDDDDDDDEARSRRRRRRRRAAVRRRRRASS